MDPQGRVWLGHADNWFAEGGVSVLDQGTWTTDAFPAWGGLSVRGFAFTHGSADVWASTSRGLLHRTPGGDELLGAANGLAADDTYGVAARVDGSLAVGTAAGVSVRAQAAWSVYGTAQGLPRAPLDYDDIDFVADVVLGRIPATDPAEVDRYVEKLDAYRRGVGCDHADRVLLLGQDLWLPGDGRTFCESAQAKFPESFARTRLYQVDGSENRASVLAALNDGPAGGRRQPRSCRRSASARMAALQPRHRRDVAGRPRSSCFYACNAGA